MVVLFAGVYLSIPLFRIHHQNIELAKGQQEGLTILVRQHDLLNQVLAVKLHVRDSIKSEFRDDEIAQKFDAMNGMLHTQEETLIASRLWREWSYATYRLALSKEQTSPTVCDKSIALLLELMQESAHQHHRSLAEELTFDFFSEDLPALMRNLTSLKVVLSGSSAADLNALNIAQQQLNEGIPRMRVAVSKLQSLNELALNEGANLWLDIFHSGPAASSLQTKEKINLEPLFTGLMAQQDFLNQLQGKRATAAARRQVSEKLRTLTLENLKIAQGLMEGGTVLIQQRISNQLNTLHDGYREVVLTLSLVAFLIAYMLYGFYLGTLMSLDALMRGTNAFCAGQRDIRISLKSRDELQQLATNFNAIAHEAERVEQTTDKQHQTRERDLRTLVDALGNKNEELYAVNQRVQEELNLARSVQLAILPQIFPNDSTWSAHACMHPARELGGDFYDCFPLPDGRYGVLVADVSGKGVGAAFFMAVSRTVLLDSALTVRTPAQVLVLANNLLCSRNPMDLFVTACYALFDPRDGTLVYASAGHHAPFIRRTDGEVEALTTSMDMALGVLTDMQYSEHTACLSLGDTLLMFTDGVTEAFSHQEIAYGEARLVQWFSNSHCQGDAKEIVDSLVQDVSIFVDGAEASDDLTCLVVCRKSASQQDLEPVI
jgi:serine phosphatase RsbU (regulator of sigma subunit)